LACAGRTSTSLWKRHSCGWPRVSWLGNNQRECTSHPSRVYSNNELSFFQGPCVHCCFPSCKYLGNLIFSSFE
jgi:hypothetical protein